MPASKYLIIPRRFRPQTFKEIMGQEAIVTTLKNALRMERFAHAYLFCGSRGTGKTTLARLFAKALNCHQLTTDKEPCNQCPACQEISSGRSLDVLEIDGASNRGIDDIREINETVGFAPASGKYKIYIIDEVHMLTKEAFNALLKTLEEPPAKVKFFFATTEPHKVPSTISSRCQRFDLARISDEACIAKLSAIASELNIPIQKEALYLIAARAEGSLRDAESLLDQLSCYAEGAITQETVSAHLGLVAKEIFFALDQAIYSGDLSFAFRFVEQLYNSGKDLSCFFDALMDHFRQLLLIHFGQKLPLLSDSEAKRYAASAKLYSKEQCLYILDYLMHEWPALSKTALKRVTLEMILLELLRSRTRVSLESLVKRLTELEGRIGGVPVVEAEVMSVTHTKDPEPEMLQEPALPESKVEEVKVEAPKPLEKLESPVIVEKIERVQEEAAKKQPNRDAAEKLRQETLLRFAAVELEGILKVGK